MPRQLRDGLVKRIIHFIDRFRLRVLRCDEQASFFYGHVADFRAVCGLIGYSLSENILRSADRILCAPDAAFRIHIFFCLLSQRCADHLQ